MKIAVLCKSPLLQNSLELFLSGYLSSLKQCDAVISDFEIQTEKPIVSVGYENCDIYKPFTRAQLFMTLEQRFEHKTYEQENVSQEKIEISIIQSEIERLTDKYKNDILQLIKKHYEGQ